MLLFRILTNDTGCFHRRLIVPIVSCMVGSILTSPSSNSDNSHQAWDCGNSSKPWGYPSYSLQTVLVPDVLYGVAVRRVHWLTHRGVAQSLGKRGYCLPTTNYSADYERIRKSYSCYKFGQSIWLSWSPVVLTIGHCCFWQSGRSLPFIQSINTHKVPRSSTRHD